jgi:hypothetical protein
LTKNNRVGGKGDSEGTHSDQATPYNIHGLSTTYYSATGASRTTSWFLQADDEEDLHGEERDSIAFKCTYLLSYIWSATKENKWDLKKRKKITYLTERY